MANLVIVESPAKCQKIQGFLGAGWRVIASMGHIRALEETLDAIGLDRDFEAKYQFLKDKGKAIKQLKDAAAEATTVYLASDDDREGEAISYSVCLLLKLNPKTTLRAVFHEITKKAVVSAIESPRHLDMNRVNAQQSRAILDMMIGFTMSPLLWRYVAPSLSAGRCQTPALRLVVDREDQIVNFKASSSWSISANWITPAAAFKFNSHMDDELEDEESAVNYMEIIHETADGTIISNDVRPWSNSAPEPLITSTLQQQASAQFSINPKDTMKIAQRLYEAGHITYMRTDKAVISEDAKAEAKQWVLENYGEEFVGQKEEKEEKQEESAPPKKTSKKKPKVATQTEAISEAKEKDGEVKAQEAHEAIRPTHMEVTALPEGASWTPYDRKVYNLIWQRAIQSVMAPARGETCKVRTQILNDEDFTWLSQWKHTTFEGWRRAGKVAQIDDNENTEGDNNEDSKEEVWANALKLNPGDKVQWQNMKAEPKETKAHGRYTEAMLVRELEKFGIGRPSTFASLIATIQDKSYVETKNIPAKDVIVKEYTLKPDQWPATIKEIKKKVGAEKNKLVPTDLGRSVLNFILKHFNDLFEYGFTSQMERRLDQVAEGKEDSKQVLRDMWASYKDRYNDLSSKQQIKSKDGEPNARLKEFSNNLKAVQSKKGPLLLIESIKKEDTQFLGWPSGVAFEDMTEELAIKFKDEVAKKKTGVSTGEWNGHLIVKKSGKFGDYLQCDSISIPYQSDEELDKTIARFEAKKNGNVKQFKDYVIRTGQYGPYIMKMSLKKPQFVSLPKGIDVTNLTEKEVEVLYKTGLESKKKWKADKK
jgi:DNA topoisomerase-1